MKLGKLKEVDIRKVWSHEQYDFSAWLAKEDNIKELSDTVGLDLTDTQTEEFVGNYRCDILCKDELTGKTVLIENQLESTNHDHLGKIITYASGLKATVIIWIVSSARREHASAIEWLNEHTDDEVSFFLLEVHAYTIGNSEPAPQFKIIEQPNDFSKSLKTMSKKAGMTESSVRHLEFWTMFNEIIEQRGKPFNIRKANTDHWYDVALGTAACHITIELQQRNHQIRIGIWIADNKDLFDQLNEKRELIESEFGENLVWDRRDGKKSSMIYKLIKGLDYDAQDNYPELMNSIIDNVVKLKKVFKKYI